MSLKREELLKSLSDEMANHALAIVTAEDSTRRQMAEMSYISFLQNLITSLIWSDISDGNRGSVRTKEVQLTRGIRTLESYP